MYNQIVHKRFIHASYYPISFSYIFEVKTIYMSSSELKTSGFSRVHSTSEDSDAFNTRDETCLIFTKGSVNFLLFYRLQVKITHV